MAAKRNPIYNEAWQMYQDGLSLEQVADEIGVTRQSVFCAFRMRGYQLRALETKPFITILGKKFTRRTDGRYRMTSGSRIEAQRFVWQKLNGPVPDGWCVIHIDNDPANNHPNNLDCVPRAQSHKYSVHNNGYCRGRKAMPVINRFCLNCGARIRGRCASYLAERMFCSRPCLGEYRRGTTKGLCADEMQKEKSKNNIYKFIQ